MWRWIAQEDDCTVMKILREKYLLLIADGNQVTKASTVIALNITQSLFNN